MKTVISENDGYKTIVEMRQVSNPAGHTHLRFLTQWDHAKVPKEEQVKFEIILSPNQIKNLKDLL